MMINRLIVLMTVLALFPGAASAQQVPPQKEISLAELSRTAVVAPETTHAPRAAPQPPPRKKDTLLNGILIGVGLGAIAGAAIGTAAIDCDECAGFNVPLTFGVVGAAAGAAIGAGIDALFHGRERVPHTAVKPEDTNRKATNNHQR